MLNLLLQGCPLLLRLPALGVELAAIPAQCRPRLRQLLLESLSACRPIRSLGLEQLTLVAELGPFPFQLLPFGLELPETVIPLPAAPAAASVPPPERRRGDGGASHCPLLRPGGG